MTLSTVTVWLLVSLGSMGTHTSRETVVVERFADRQECVRVMDFLNGDLKDDFNRRKIHTCIDAKIAILPNQKD